MSDRSSFVVVRLTPSGRGAIATLLVEGSGALAVVQASFRSARGRPLDSFAPDRLAFGHFGPEPGEEVVVRVQSEQSVELHCHGGQAAVAMVEQALVEQGCRPIPWREWAPQGSEDPLAAAALLALAETRTERTAAILLDQYQGALSRAIAGIRELLKRQEPASAREKIEILLGRAPLGLHLVEPWRVVVAGPANVGKSSLVNAMLGYCRAIVDPVAGTTRDVVTATTAVEGWPVDLCDTAGLRPSGHPVEQAGIELTQQSLATADLVFLVFDLTQPWSASDEELFERYPDAVVVHNKSDLMPDLNDSPLPFAGEGPGVRAPGILTSALCKTGIEDVLCAIFVRLVPNPPEPGVAVPFTQDQVNALRRASQALSVGDTASARHVLDSFAPRAK
jgi:tRNA modification GTPase